MKCDVACDGIGCMLLVPAAGLYSVKSRSRADDEEDEEDAILLMMVMIRIMFFFKGRIRRNHLGVSPNT